MIIARMQVPRRAQQLGPKELSGVSTAANRFYLLHDPIHAILSHYTS